METLNRILSESQTKFYLDSINKQKFLFLLQLFCMFFRLILLGPQTHREPLSHKLLSSVFPSAIIIDSWHNKRPPPTAPMEAFHNYSGECSRSLLVPPPPIVRRFPTRRATRTPRNNVQEITHFESWLKHSTPKPWGRCHSHVVPRSDWSGPGCHNNSRQYANNSWPTPTRHGRRQVASLALFAGLVQGLGLTTICRPSNFCCEEFNQVKLCLRDTG